ncbi:MAG: hypothetical protein LUG95_01970 [Clostridiales bacterium]|nr:hypothetical protein [Clostridiales bacterium]
MKLTLKTDRKDFLICRVDNKIYKNINLKNRYQIVLPENAKKIEIVHNNNEKKNIIGFIILSIVSFFLESQKTFEKREFISFYEFAADSLVSNFWFKTQEAEIKNETSVLLEEKDFGKFNCFYWVSEDVQIHNWFSKKSTKKQTDGVNFVLVYNTFNSYNNICLYYYSVVC